ncbi:MULTISPECIES: Crp/Fnr family transcriptional regulator [Paraburkholderia]|uniref:Crp/Fnr family transcriptional regulator n=1 Tax=Paraburkholderia TaxID=1822464 RepID=UPI001CB4940A|nr:Crp/Fnr family transcriptional regulator [Paraburkholderia caribensis]CAG9259385.1 transcriptional regulator, Crp/Fnr family [Paraburkholderia caribensis]
MTRQTKVVTATLSVDELLAQSPWFVALDDAAKTRVRADITERAVAAGQSLGRHGERQQMWFGVLEGIIKWSITARDGQTVTLGGQSMGSWFGEGTLIRNAPRESDLIALRDSRVAQLPRVTFVWLRENRPSFNEFLLHQMNERLHWFMGAVAAHGLLDTDSLVARALVGMVQPLSNPSGTVHLPLSQEELANLAAVSRQTCNKAMTRFKNAGLVRTEYGGIVVLDLPGLNALSR